MEEQATWIDFVDGSVGELVGQKIVHQDAVVLAQELGQDSCREVAAGADAAEELSNGWNPADLKMGQWDSGVCKDGEGCSGMELCPIEGNLKEGSEL